MRNAAAIKLLAISGSLREKSSNSTILQAIAAQAPEHVEFIRYRGLDQLPHFNPDDDDDNPPASVREWREQLRSADGVLICTPEYAGGVPGSLKNALDWIVSSGEFMNKKVALISASPSMLGGDKAHASLAVTLTMMDAIIVEGASLILPMISKKLNTATGEVIDAETKEALSTLLEALLTSLIT